MILPTISSSRSAPYQEDQAELSVSKLIVATLKIRYPYIKIMFSVFCKRSDYRLIKITDRTLDVFFQDLGVFRSR